LSFVETKSTPGFVVCVHKRRAAPSGLPSVEVLETTVSQLGERDIEPVLRLHRTMLFK